MNDDELCLLCKKYHEPQPAVVLHASPEDSAEAWAKDTALMVQALADMHRLAFGTVSREAVAEMAKGYAELLPPAGSLIARCVARLESVNHDYGKYGRLSEGAGTDPDRLGLLAASVYGVLEGLEGVT